MHFQVVVDEHAEVDELQQAFLEIHVNHGLLVGEAHLAALHRFQLGVGLVVALHQGLYLVEGLAVDNLAEEAQAGVVGFDAAQAEVVLAVEVKREQVVVLVVVPGLVLEVVLILRLVNLLGLATRVRTSSIVVPKRSGPMPVPRIISFSSMLLGVVVGVLMEGGVGGILRKGKGKALVLASRLRIKQG